MIAWDVYFPKMNNRLFFVIGSSLKRLRLRLRLRSQYRDSWSHVIRRQGFNHTVTQAFRIVGPLSSVNEMLLWSQFICQKSKNVAFVLFLLLLFLLILVSLEIFQDETEQFTQPAVSMLINYSKYKVHNIHYSRQFNALLNTSSLA